MEPHSFREHRIYEGKDSQGVMTVLQDHQCRKCDIICTTYLDQTPQQSQCNGKEKEKWKSPMRDRTPTQKDYPKKKARKK